MWWQAAPVPPADGLPFHMMSRVSTRNLGGFFEPYALLRVWKNLSILDAILCAEPEYRYHSFHSKWSPGMQVGFVKNGAGDEMYGLFIGDGVLIKGFDHESIMSPYARDDEHIWPGICDQVPKRLLSQLDDPAFVKSDVTFCVWRCPSDRTWQIGDIEFPDEGDDGSSFLLGTLFRTAADYCRWAKSYFDVDVPVRVIEEVYRGEPITPERIRMINPNIDLEALSEDAAEIGCPLG